MRLSQEAFLSYVNINISKSKLQYRKDVENAMGDPIKDEEKSIMLNGLRQFGSQFGTGFIVTDPMAGKDSIVFVNKSFTQITGYSFEEVHGENLKLLHGKETDQNLIKVIDQKLKQGETVIEEVFHYKKDGTPFWSKLFIQPIFGKKGQMHYITSVLLDITDRKVNESLLRQHKRIFTGAKVGEGLDGLLQNICNEMKMFFPEGVDCAYFYKEGKEKWAIQGSESLPKALKSRIETSLSLEKDYTKSAELLVKEIPKSEEHDFAVMWLLPICDVNGQAMEALLIFVRELKDPTDVQVKYLKSLIPVIQMARNFVEQQDKLYSLAYFDWSTGLPNRYAMTEKIKENIKKKIDYFVVAVELNEYTSLSDLFGRDIADELFIQLAKRIGKVRKDNHIGMLSSSSIIFINDSSDQPDAKELIAQLRRITDRPFTLAGEEVFITLKAGVALSDNECSAEEMVRRADIALTSAEGKAGGTVLFYKDLQNEETIKEMTIANELMKALITDGLDVHLQPKVNLKTSEIIGFEALARWNSSVLGQVQPNVFIPIAENTGKIIDLEIDILTKILKWQKERIGLGKKMYQVAVNISVDHFFHPSFVLVLKQLVSEYGVPPKYIRLEITESIGLVDFKQAKQIFAKLNNLDFEVSIDDFGVGYSSLSYLPQLQVSELKIDRSFISALDERETHAVVMTIIQLANSLNLATVAEGIEEKHQIEALISLGCQVGQGFYYYKPMRFDEIDLLIG